MINLHSKAVLLSALLIMATSALAQPAFRGAASATAAAATPTFRAATSAATTTSTLAISKPAGVALNDVMVSSVAVTPSSATITPPPGWTLVRRTNNAGPTSNSLAIYYKVAAAGEPTSFSWGVTGISFAVGGIQAFTGIDTASPIAIENGQTTATSTSHATPSIVTPVSNSMLVTSHAFASSRTWTPPSGMTESFDKPSGSNNATGLSIEGARVLQPAAAASGTKSASAAGDADAGNAHILALRPASAVLAIPKPTGTVRDDTMIASVAFNNTAASIVPPTGWTLIRRMDNAAPTSNSLAVYYKVAGLTEPSSYSWTITGGEFPVGGIQAFSLMDIYAPIAGENGQSTPSGTNHDTPSIFSYLNTFVVTTQSYASSRTWTPQSGVTEAYDRPSGSNSATGQSITGGHYWVTSVGETGPKRATAAGYADAGNAHIITLYPNAPPPDIGVGILSPEDFSTFPGPANITIEALAFSRDGVIEKVDFFYGGTNLIGTVTTEPYTINWTNVPPGTHVITAFTRDSLGRTSTSYGITVVVEPTLAQLYFINVDHLNTPRLIENQSQQTVWTWDQHEPFGINAPNENPGGFGVFEFSLRFPGQYFDKETNLHYNYFRDYDPGVGRYLESDPIGLEGGLNTYAYVEADVLGTADEYGLRGFKPPKNRPGANPKAQKPVPQKPANAGRCTPERHRTLQNWVNFWCKTPWVSNQCYGIQKCIDARRHINSECYGGGDAGHNQAIKEKQAQLCNQGCFGSSACCP